ncbi:MAG: hypothetical protein A2X32_10045 [Elusimicrobia bacterium GWC2_64_44]|nr:MAG: hypothetical protein A2X32_10045 [Elusimicrobia bacterium GWC2_64_44]
MQSEPVKRHCKSELFNILSWGGGKRYYREEELHSNILAWLFHPKESHGLGAKAAHAFFSRINPEISLGSDYRVTREASKTNSGRYRKADIIIESDHEYIAIENKWKARLSHGQMSDTYERFRATAEKKGKRFVYIVLAKSSQINIDEKTPHLLTNYSVICDVIRELLPFGTESPAMLLKEYAILLSEKASNLKTCRAD